MSSPPRALRPKTKLNIIYKHSAFKYLNAPVSSIVSTLQFQLCVLCIARWAEIQQLLSTGKIYCIAPPIFIMNLWKIQFLFYSFSTFAKGDSSQFSFCLSNAYRMNRIWSAQQQSVYFQDDQK